MLIRKKWSWYHTSDLGSTLAEDQKTRESNQPVVDTDKRRCKPDARIESRTYGYKAKQWKQNGREDHASHAVHDEQGDWIYRLILG